MPDEASPTVPAILRCWSSRIRTRDRAAYVRYIEETGLQDYRETPGNLGCQMLMRDCEGGVTQVTTLSWWTSLAAIEAFAGPEVTRARYYPRDDAFLLEKPEHVEHHTIVADGLRHG
jgi:heme-degrading monooxygenase HmoA